MVYRGGCVFFKIPFDYAQGLESGARLLKRQVVSAWLPFRPSLFTGPCKLQQKRSLHMLFVPASANLVAIMIGNPLMSHVC